MTLGSAVSRQMVATGLVQGLLLAPSLALSVVGVATMSINEYAAWALLFALGTGSIILDFGAFQLAQVQRAEGLLSGREIARLFGQATIAPAVLAVGTTMWWQTFLDAFIAGSDVATGAVPLLLGVAAILRAWQNVANGLALGAGEEGPRRRAAALSAGGQVGGVALLLVMPAIYGLSLAYLVGGAMGLAALIGLVRGSFGRPPERGPSNVGVRTLIGGLNVSLTQLDRLLVAVFGTPIGLAAYDFAARLISTTKLGCVLVATGAAAQSARRAGNQQESAAYLATAQRFLDRLSLAAFVIAPAAVLVLALIARTEIAREAVTLAIILSIGQGINATTATATGYLSGLRRPQPELVYLLISGTMLLLCVWPMGQAGGAVGVAGAVSLALATGSVWMRTVGLRVGLAGRPMNRNGKTANGLHDTEGEALPSERNGAVSR